MQQGHLDKAIAFYQQSARQDPALARNYLSLAAAYQGKSEDELAALYMAQYLELQPDHFTARAQYADLLLGLNQPTEARQQLERFIADIQDCEELARQHLVHSHTRLMAIAESEKDSYGEHLHRGIALYRLACRQQAEAEHSDKYGDVESLLCRAAGELALARGFGPDEARPSWYLYEVWTLLGQHEIARRSLRAAEAAAVFSYLTPVEQRGLRLALWKEK